MTSDIRDDVILNMMKILNKKISMNKARGYILYGVMMRFVVLIQSVWKIDCSYKSNDHTEFKYLWLIVQV